jgi:hypothetical protein
VAFLHQNPFFDPPTMPGPQITTLVHDLSAQGTLDSQAWHAVFVTIASVCSSIASLIFRAVVQELAEQRDGHAVGMAKAHLASKT